MSLKCTIIPVTPFQQNSTLVWNDETMVGASIDPGGDIDQILSARDEAGMTIEKIFLTHGHLDHASGTMDLADRLGFARRPSDTGSEIWFSRCRGGETRPLAQGE